MVIPCRDPLVDTLAEEAQEIIRTKKRIKSMDAECQLNLLKLTLILSTLSLCLYCALVCSDCLLVIVIVAACCCSRIPLLAVPLLVAAGLYMASHTRTIDQILTISEDISSFNRKYQEDAK